MTETEAIELATAQVRANAHPDATEAMLLLAIGARANQLMHDAEVSAYVKYQQNTGPMAKRPACWPKRIIVDTEAFDNYESKDSKR